MAANQVLFSFFRYSRNHSFGAFVLMGFQSFVASRSVPMGALRLMTCGSGNGFSIVPDLTRYCLMTVPSQPGDLVRLRTNRLYRWVAGPSIEQLHFLLRPVSGHGTWDGNALFDYSNHRLGDRPFAVLTRARVAAGRAMAFWRRVPEVSRSLGDIPGCIYHVGFGAHPLLRLATFSVWRDLESMQEFAYRRSRHRAALEEARADDWLPESMFVRFEIESIQGNVERYPRLLALAPEIGIGTNNTVLGGNRPVI
ncbi:hypothetical protein [Rhodoplanes sp. SY1]|uniref:hypothetical protein n=1 Tax=Rhodoplanes sp. SY1 TaxID=3166646 RepID=UPI0038B5E947